MLIPKGIEPPWTPTRRSVAARLERTLLRAAPSTRLVREGERGIEEALEEERAKTPSTKPIDAAAHPDLAQAMEQVMRGFEVGWVDESLPVLSGLTPRQAVMDERRVRSSMRSWTTWPGSAAVPAGAGSWIPPASGCSSGWACGTGEGPSARRSAPHSLAEAEPRSRIGRGYSCRRARGC